MISNAFWNIMNFKEETWGFPCTSFNLLVCQIQWMLQGSKSIFLYQAWMLLWDFNQTKNQ